jgi:two-component system sensor histidine kinase DesK
MAHKVESSSPKLWWDFRYIWLFISTIWVFVLVGGVIDIWQERIFFAASPNSPVDVVVSPKWVQISATILVIAFIALYVRIMYRMYFGRLNWTSEISSRERWNIRTPILLIALVLVFLPHEDRLENWPFVFVYVVIVWTLTAGPNSAFSAVVISTAGTALILSLAYDSGVILDIPIYALAFGFFTSGYVINRGLINELRLEQSRVRDQAVTEERFRLARDLHDTVGHSMTQITLKAELARRLLPDDPTRAADELEQIEQLSRSLSAEVRASIAGDTSLTLDREIDRAKELLASIDVKVSIAGEHAHLPEDVANTFAWCLREGMMNIVKHSGADHCEIEFFSSNHHYVLKITDNGSNPGNDQPYGQGIQGMKQRVEELNGELRFWTVDAGHTLEIMIPV